MPVSEAAAAAAAGPIGSASCRPLIEMSRISKRFLDVVATRDVDFAVFPGEICALLGENGAGKTTLMNVLFGFYTADSGEIRVQGEPIATPSPKEAIRRGIQMIHQHFALVPPMSVLENVILGHETGAGPFLDLDEGLARLAALQSRFGMNLDPAARVWTLSVGEQQKVEILKALYRGARVLIMDEPTAVLVPSEIVELFKTLRTFASQGNGVVFISHKLNEVMEISSRIVVLRNGQVVASRATARTTPRELASLMVGGEVVERARRSGGGPGDPVLEISGLEASNDKGVPAVKRVDLTVRQREIVGIAGVSGNGQRELAEVVFGLRTPSGGSVTVGATRLVSGDPSSSIAAGMARIPEDRIATGLLMSLSIADNLILENHGSGEFLSFCLMDHDRIRRHGERLIHEYHIKATGPAVVAGSLSGGNLQKVILARSLSSRPRVIVAAQPTRGLDVGAAQYIHGRLFEERDRGAAIVLISEDLDEILAVSDRIVVMYEGRIVGEVPADRAARDQLGLWMSGVVG
ncbi:MAG: ABC transporter ATP-binding protein [Candidatus Riflebacteria bacterium]|nr:ABC transporter ATP-binding protein [Candidatus Riflebacteria bacterium]